MVRIPLLAGLLFSGFFQMPSAPPMKMGLWEQTTVTNMKVTGAKVPPGMPTNQTLKTRACYTQETWTHILLNNQNTSCTFSNQSITGTHLSLDMTCAKTTMEDAHGRHVSDARDRPWDDSYGYEQLDV